MIDIAIIKEESRAEVVESLKTGFGKLYGLSCTYTDRIEEADREKLSQIIDLANIHADLQAMRRKSYRNDHYICLCRVVIDHWVSWVGNGKKPEEDPFTPASPSLGIYHRLLKDLGHTW